MQYTGWCQNDFNVQGYRGSAAPLPLTSSLPTRSARSIGAPDEVAKAIMFVTENEFATGTTVDVDGGWLLS